MAAEPQMSRYTAPAPAPAPRRF